MSETHLQLLPPVSVPIASPERSHHKFGPSKMGYINECAGFTSRNEVNEAAEQGTMLHGLMEEMIAKVIAKIYKTTLEQIADWVIPSRPVGDDEREFLRYACKRIDVFLKKNPTRILVEINVQTFRHDNTELNHGFLDVLFFFSESIAILIDFKFGWVPVKPAKENLQGINYALGIFQRYPLLQKIGVEFLMPKLNWVTSHVFNRIQIGEMLDKIQGAIERAEQVQRSPETSQHLLKVGLYCDYCAMKGSCTVLSASRGAVTTRMEGVQPMPRSFVGVDLSKPDDVALALYWVNIVEKGLEEVKKRAFEIAEANGGTISVRLADGSDVTYEIKERNMGRTLGAPIAVAEALQEILTPAEVLGCATLQLTKLEPAFATAFVEQAALRGEKVTKKYALEVMASTLEANNLLTSGEGKVRFLKRAAPVKQITNKQ